MQNNNFTELFDMRSKNESLEDELDDPTVQNEKIAISSLF